MNFRKLKITLIFFLIISGNIQIFSQNNTEEQETKPQKSEGIHVIGNKKEDLKKIPGSAYIIDKKYLEEASPTDPMEALRRTPGASVRFQDAAGLTPNIGFRGVSNEESRKTLILEDGILTSLSPYGQPESYYTPSIERMERIEIIKGSGSILFGPNTIGGIVNFVTKRPPAESTFYTKNVGGENGYLSTYNSYGKSFGSSAFEVSLLRKQGNGFRNHQSFDVTEGNVKWIQDWNQNHSTTIKLGYHMQNAQSTYLGLSQGLFRMDPKINPAEYDEKQLNRSQTIISHNWKLSDDHNLMIRGYFSQAERNWARQDFLSGKSTTGGYLNAPLDTIRTYSPGIIGNRPGDTIYMRESYISRDQSFMVGGIETKLESKFSTFGLKHETDIGVRIHGENNLTQTNVKKTDDPLGYLSKAIIQEDSLLNNLVQPSLPNFNLNRQERKIESFAAYFQDRIQLSENWKLIPGVRYEEVRQKAITTRRQATTEDYRLGTVLPNDVSVNRRSSSESRTHVILPGLGITYDITKKFIWFSGAHKGFSPPTFGTSFSPQGNDYRLKPETSTNYETGIRGDITSYLYTELVGYKMYFRDQIINVNEVGGENGIRPANTGYSTHTGGESVIVWDPAKMQKSEWRVPIELIYSRIEAKSRSFNPFPVSQTSDGREVVEYLPAYTVNNYQYLSTDTTGNYLPYVPKETVTTAISVSSPQGYYGRLEYQYIGKQYSDLLNTKDESEDGNKGIIPKIELWNTSFGYRSPDKWSVFINAKNIQDKQYVSGRLPTGIQPGPFRQINVGFTLEL
ncbi:TonB-dependent receptor family protein [Leptospira terpstrae]|uniref:TonB-dependent receptor family protein n=1 Tax=Leptospira terpstrae TaxID=293075 RepID=UPI003D020E91